MLCLENILKHFSVENIKKTGLNVYAYDLSVDYNIINNSNSINIHKYFMNRSNITKSLGSLKKFIRLLTSTVSAFNYTKCISLKNQKCVAEPSLNNLHANEYTQGLHYYPFAVFLDRFIGSCNTLNFNDLSNGVFVLNQTEDVDLKVFNMITETTESKTLTNTYHANINASLMVEI